MVIRLTEKRIGGGIKKEREDLNTERRGSGCGKTLKKVSRFDNMAADHITKYYPKLIIRPASSLPSWQACLGL